MGWRSGAQDPRGEELSGVILLENEAQPGDGVIPSVYLSKSGFFPFVLQCWGLKVQARQVLGLRAPPQPGQAFRCQSHQK